MRDISFTYEGGDVALLLIHGLTGTPAEIKGVAKAISRQGFTVHGVQLAGHCGSEADLLKTGWRDWYGSVTRAFDNLRSRYHTVFVGGLSLGALLALKLASERPDEVAGLTLYSITLFHDGWALPRTQFLLRPALALGFGRWVRFAELPPYGIKDERLRARVVRAMQSGDSASGGNVATPGLSLIELYRLIDDVKIILPRVTSPSIIVHARHDDITSLRNAEYVAERIAGPSEIVILENSYHMVTIDSDRQILIDQTIEFMRRLCDASVHQKAQSPSLELA